MNSPGFSADLTSFDLLDLVQVIHLDRRDLCLMVRAGQQSLGVLRFRQGELLWAEFGETTGEAAFLALATQQYGNLEQLPWMDTGERNVYQPLSRLIMQAVAYRDQQGRPEADDDWSNEGWGQPPAAFEPGPLAGRVGNGNQQYPGGTPFASVAVAETELEMPDWMRQVYPSVEEIAAQPTGIMPLAPVSAVPEQPPAAPPSRLLAGTHTPPPLPALPTDEPPAAPTGTPSLLNGKRSLPGLFRGIPRNNATVNQAIPEDPPTIPLPSVPGSLLEYAPRRDQPAVPPVEEQGTKPLSGAEQEPAAEEETLAGGATSILTALASAGSLATSASAASAPASEGASVPAPALPGEPVEGVPARASGAAPAPLVAGPPPATSGAGEVKPSSLSLLEQLAYGGARHAQAAEGAAPTAGVNGAAAPISGAPFHGATPVNNAIPAALGASALNGAAPAAPGAPALNGITQAPPGAVLNGVTQAPPGTPLHGGPSGVPGAASPLPPGEPTPAASERTISSAIAGPANGKRSALSKPAAGTAGGAAPGADVSGGALVWPLSAEVTQKLQEVLEGFALQVGPAFLATAMLRADGTVVAQHMANKRVEHDLSSAAYHLAHVMQSSLRALLMGGWGDLDETLISGSTHTVVLRRLGLVEKGLFHMAVLERSGNHGLCRVLMRNTEPVLLQALAPR